MSRKPILAQTAVEINPVFRGLAELCPMRYFRRNAEFATDSRAFKPIDRNERVRIVIAAEALERRTKAKGRKSGVLGQSALRVLRSLLFDFCAIPTGRCCPSYEAIRERTGFCYGTISGALKRLEVSGLVRIVRRIIRTRFGARQTSNAYAFSGSAQGERKPDYSHPRETTNLLKNKSMQPSLPGLALADFGQMKRELIARWRHELGLLDEE